MEEAYGTTGTITMVESLIRVDSGNNEDVIHLEIKHVNGSIYKAKPGCNKPICIFYFKNLPKGFYLVKAVTNKGREIEGKVFRK